MTEKQRIFLRYPSAGLPRLFWLLCLLVGLALMWSASAQDDARHAVVMTIKGTIGPATSDYYQRGLKMAQQSQAELVVVELDTPGGLSSSMRDMISVTLASDVPVAVYVYPSGSRAASAGTYLLYASHIAAMAPATHLGAATPVQIGGGLLGDSGEGEADGGTDTDKGGADNDGAGESGANKTGGSQAQRSDEPGGKRRGKTAMQRKTLEDAVAYIRSLASRHGRNADWAELAVREGRTLTAQEALDSNVIDVITTDPDDLLAQINGCEVVMVSGNRALDTTNLTIERFAPDWRTRLLAVITDPNVAYFLMIIGFYGLVFELANPGTLVPGTIGLICLLLALFAFGMLPINYAGLALIIAGMGLIVGEALMPSFGILGIGGIVAFVIGSVILMDADSLSISLPLIGGVAVVAAGLMLWILVRFVGLRNKPSRTGQEELLNSSAHALEDFDAFGHVQLRGERWRARTSQPIRKGQTLRIIAIDGLTVEVEPQDNRS